MAIVAAWHLIKDDQFRDNPANPTFRPGRPPHEALVPLLGNHDRPRIESRIGREQARLVAVLLLTLRGTPTIYYGDEIGMLQVPIAPEQVRDPFERNVPGIGVGRDGCRTPMQWDATSNAGFSSAPPWLSVGDDFRHENVENQRCDPASMLNLYRRTSAGTRSRVLPIRSPRGRLRAYRMLRAASRLSGWRR